MMNRSALFAICMALILCLAACSPTAPAPAPTEEPTEEPTASPTEAPTEDPDAGMTRLSYGLRIPTPGFGKLTWDTQDNINLCTVYISNADYTSFQAYVDALPGFGYTVESSGEGYTAYDPEGNELLLSMSSSSSMQISIYVR